MRYLMIAGLLTLAAAPASAAQIDVSHPWARATPGGTTTGAVYVTLTDPGAPDALTGVSTPAAGMAEVHETINDNGTMKMRPVGSVPLATGKPVTMAPGGYHIMLMDLKAPLKAGDSFPLTLRFAHAGPETVTVKVEPIGASSGGMGGMNGMSGMGGMGDMHH